MQLIDLSGVLFSTLFTQQGSELSENLIRHQVLNTLRSINAKNRDQYGQMILCADGGSSWRKAIFPQYKASRHTNREKDGKDWDKIFEIFTNIRSEIKEYVPFKLLHVQGIEADDIIATLVKKTQEGNEFGLGEAEPVLIVSNDGDFIQLQRYKNVRQFSPMKKALVHEKDPLTALREKVLRGDSGDGIPNVLSGDKCFVDSIRQTSLSSKKVEAWIANWSKLKQLMDETTYRNFQRNQVLIDLDNIPSDKAELILKTYEETQVAPNGNLMNYLISKRCGVLIESAQDFFSK